MKISELIELLKNIEGVEGDLQVGVLIHEFGTSDPVARVVAKDALRAGNASWDHDNEDLGSRFVEISS
ncbi:MAG: hypothetical protein Hals2KO_21210 [Halioglobus sp.]